MTIWLKAVILFAMLLQGCASTEGHFGAVRAPEERKFTQEEDAMIYEHCGGDCAIIPGEVWREIMKRLGLRAI